MSKFTLFALALAGCGAVDLGPVPDRFTLNDRQLTVALSDGAICRADMSGQDFRKGSAPITGDFATCAGLSYEITPKGRSHLAQAGLGAFFAPYTELTLRRAGREWRYETPKEPRETADEAE